MTSYGRTNGYLLNQFTLQPVATCGTSYNLSFSIQLLLLLVLSWRVSQLYLSSIEWIAYVDATVFGQSDFIGFDALFEDAKSFFLMALSCYTEGGHGPAICYTDNLCLFYTLNFNCLENSHFCLLISDYKDILACRTNISVFWIRRSENISVYSLVRASILCHRYQL